MGDILAGRDELGGLHPGEHPHGVLLASAAHGDGPVEVQDESQIGPAVLLAVYPFEQYLLGVGRDGELAYGQGLLGFPRDLVAGLEVALPAVVGLLLIPSAPVVGPAVLTLAVIGFAVPAVVATGPGLVVGPPIAGTAVVPRTVAVRLPVAAVPGPVPVLPVPPRLIPMGSAAPAGLVAVGLPLAVALVGPPLPRTAVVPRTAVAVRLPVVPAVASGSVAVGSPPSIALVLPAGPVGSAAGIVPLLVVRLLAVAGSVSGPSPVAVPVRLLSVPSAAVAAVFALRSVSGSGVFFRGGHGISRTATLDAY